MSGRRLMGPVLGLLILGPAQAAVFDVDRFDDDPTASACTPAAADCSLRGAVLAAGAAPGADTVNLPAGTFTLEGTPGEDVGITGDLDILGELTLVGAGADLTRIAGGGIDRVLDVHAAGRLVARRLTVTGGAVAEVAAAGGGVRLAAGGRLELVDVVVAENRVVGDDGRGGGIADLGGEVRLERTEVRANSVLGADGSGGGVYAAGRLDLVASDLIGNRALGELGQGGGLYIDRGSASLVEAGVHHNETLGETATGGGIVNSAGVLDVIDSELTRNRTNGTTGLGGALVNTGDALLLRTTVADNRTSGLMSRGGGIFHLASTLDLEASTLARNRTVGNESHGGGLAAGGLVDLINSTVSGNRTTGSGSDGGGIFFDTGLLTLRSVTVADNRASLSDGRGGGLFAFATGSVRLHNTLLAANRAGGGGPDCFAALFSEGYNLLADSAGCSGPVEGVAGDRVGPPGAPLDARLEPLALNPPGTTETHALGPGSPAIDAGDPADCPPADQRGVMRPVAGAGRLPVCDIGAYEAAAGIGSLTPIPVLGGPARLLLVLVLAVLAVRRLYLA